MRPGPRGARAGPGRGQKGGATAWHGHPARGDSPHGQDARATNDLDLAHSNLYNVACAAALASAGQGGDKPPLDEKDKARRRKQALNLLKAELAHWTKQAETGKPEAKALVRQKLEHWTVDTDLAGIRDKTALKALPEDDQKACRALWAEVDALLAKVRADTAP